MAGTNEAFSRGKIDTQLRDQGWDAAFNSLLARAFVSDQVNETAPEEVAVA
jgi:hypothetical protein